MALCTALASRRAESACAVPVVLCNHAGIREGRRPENPLRTVLRTGVREHACFGVAPLESRDGRGDQDTGVNGPVLQCGERWSRGADRDRLDGLRSQALRNQNEIEKLVGSGSGRRDTHSVAGQIAHCANRRGHRRRHHQRDGRPRVETRRYSEGVCLLPQGRWIARAFQPRPARCRQGALPSLCRVRSSRIPRGRCLPAACNRGFAASSTGSHVIQSFGRAIRSSCADDDDAGPASEKRQGDEDQHESVHWVVSL